MPLSKYNSAFGGKPGNAAKAHAAMIEEYGEKKGESVFYAKVNKKKKSGKNAFFGGKLPFEIGREGGEWFDGCRPSSPSSFKKGK